MSKHKLLLADDSITIQKVVNLTFADEGIEVLTVGDGNSAMEKLAEFSPDLVMADVYMPGLSGYEVCEKIKQNSETQHIPVILLVGSFEPYDEGEAQRVGADDYLTKPFQSIRQLVNKVNELLTRNEQALPAESETPSVQEETAPISFAETLEMAPPVAVETDLGSAGMDDEMIETSRFGDFSTEESAVSDDDYGKTKPLSHDDLKEFAFAGDKEDLNEMPAESIYGELESDETLDLTADQPSEFEFERPVTDTEPVYLSDEPAVDESPVSFEESEPERYVAEKGFATVGGEFDLPESNIPTDEWPQPNAEISDKFEEEPAVTESAPETESFEDDSAESNEMPDTEEEISAPVTFAEDVEKEAVEADETFKTTSVAETDETTFDDSDLLELPPLVEETGIRPLDEPTEQAFTAPEPKLEPEPESAESETVPESEIAPEPQSEVEPEPETEPETETVTAEETPKMTFSPELIEAIASKVAEKLSAKVIQSLTADVVPEVTEQIIKEITEENLKK